MSNCRLLPLFEVLWTDTAKGRYEVLKSDPSQAKRAKVVKKRLEFLSSNPCHRGLRSRHFTSLTGPKGEKVFEAYAEHSTPAAYRVFWHYGPRKEQITVITITPHP